MVNNTNFFFQNIIYEIILSSNFFVIEKKYLNSNIIFYYLIKNLCISNKFYLNTFSYINI